MIARERFLPLAITTPIKCRNYPQKKWTNEKRSTGLTFIEEIRKLNFQKRITLQGKNTRIDQQNTKLQRKRRGETPRTGKLCIWSLKKKNYSSFYLHKLAAHKFSQPRPAFFIAEAPSSSRYWSSFMQVPGAGADDLDIDPSLCPEKTSSLT